MISLVLSVAGILSLQAPKSDTTHPPPRVATAIIGPNAGQERMMQETLDRELERKLSGSHYRLYRSSPPLLWSILSDLRVAEDTAILGSLDAIRTLKRLDVLIAAFVLRPERGQMVVSAAVFSAGARDERGDRFVAQGGTMERALRNLADSVAAGLRRHAGARNRRR